MAAVVDKGATPISAFHSGGFSSAPFPTTSCYTLKTRGTSTPPPQDNEGGRTKDGTVKGRKSKSERPRCGRRLKGERAEGALRVRPEGGDSRRGTGWHFSCPGRKHGGCSSRTTLES